jgi:hypothetical protein
MERMVEVRMLCGCVVGGLMERKQWREGSEMEGGIYDILLVSRRDVTETSQRDVPKKAFEKR